MIIIIIIIIIMAEYREESWKLGETCCLENSSERPSAKTDVKNSNNNNNNNKNVNNFQKLIR